VICFKANVVEYFPFGEEWHMVVDRVVDAFVSLLEGFLGRKHDRVTLIKNYIVGLGKVCG
jgi:hypothetical protein